jgi:hypothetical protein
MLKLKIELRELKKFLGKTPYITVGYIPWGIGSFAQKPFQLPDLKFSISTFLIP